VAVFQDGSSSYAAHPKDLDMLHAIFAAPCRTTFCRLDELGLEAVGQRVEPDQAVIACQVAEPDPGRQKCRSEGLVRDPVRPRGCRP
jgi:transposase